MSGSLPGSAGPPMPQGGLLQPSAWSSGPPPLPSIPGLLPPGGMPPVGIPSSSEQMLAMFMRQDRPEEPHDLDDELPPALRPFAAQLRPTVRPTGSPWQQEIVYETLGKTDEEIATIARYYYKIAQTYDQSLSRERITASQYYAGRPLGDEAAGRSQLVLTTVRDTIRSMLPSLLRVLTGSEDPVTFSPVSAEIAGNDQLATMLSRQAQDYVRWALYTANPGWQIIHDILLDALTRKCGWARWYWGAQKAVRTEVCEGLLLPQLSMILSDPGMIAQRIVRRPMTKRELQAVQKIPEANAYLQQGGAPEYWSAHITRSTQQGWPQIQAVPSECVWIVADSDTVAGSRGIFHVRDVTASELIELGLPPEAVLAAAGESLRPQQRREAIARNEAQGYAIRSAPPNDRSMAIIRYAEGWIRADADNDNVSELIHVHLLGDGAQLVKWQRTDEIPLAAFTPYREPGRVIGSSVADYVMDLQRIESRVMRSTLDALGQSMHPRTVVTLGQVNLADARQTAIGSIIRVAQQGAVQEISKPFPAKDALPILDVLEGIRESRTGITRASQGLTVDELQSTSPVAVNQQTSAAQDRLDMIARTLAETGLAALYSGILKMLARQQDRPSVVMIRGQWMALDPRALSTMWTTAVNVGGRGTAMERMVLLSQIAQKQEQLIMQAGPTNPLAGLAELRNTYAAMLTCANISDVSSFFKQLPPGWQPPQQPQPPNTDLILAEMQQAKTAADTETSRAKASTDRTQVITDDERQRQQAALDAWIQAYKTAAQYGSPLPSIDEFKQAMTSKIPAPAMLASVPVPPPGSPQPPATTQQKAPPQPGAPPMGQMGPGRPMVPPRQMPAPPQGTMTPSSQIARQNMLAGQGAPSAYGSIANRAMAGALFGPGGPQMPAPGGGAPAQ